MKMVPGKFLRTSLLSSFNRVSLDSDSPDDDRNQFLHIMYICLYVMSRHFITMMCFKQFVYADNFPGNSIVQTSHVSLLSFEPIRSLVSYSL